MNKQAEPTTPPPATPLFTTPPRPSLLPTPLTPVEIEEKQVQLFLALSPTSKMMERAHAMVETCLVPSDSTPYCMDDVVGLAEAKDVIQEVLLVPTWAQQNLSTAAVDTKNKNIGVILHGAPGTGKTMFAQSCSSSLENSSLMVVNCAATICGCSVPGCKAMNMVLAIFRVARLHHPCVIVFEEVDSLLSRPSQARDTWQQCMTEMKDWDQIVMVVATTNHLKKCANNPASLERFAKKIHIPLPSPGDRQKLLQRFMREASSTVVVAATGVFVFQLSSTEMNQLVGDLDKWSGRRIKDLIYSAVRKAAFVGSSDSNNKICISRKETITVDNRSETSIFSEGFMNILVPGQGITHDVKFGTFQVAEAGLYYCECIASVGNSTSQGPFTLYIKAGSDSTQLKYKQSQIGVVEDWNEYETSSIAILLQLEADDFVDFTIQTFDMETIVGGVDIGLLPTTPSLGSTTAVIYKIGGPKGTSGTYYDFTVACSDLVTKITAVSTRAEFHTARAFSMTAVYLSLTTAQTDGNALTIQVLKNGVVVATQAIANTVSYIAATLSTPQAFAEGDKITIKISQVCLACVLLTNIKIFQPQRLSPPCLPKI